MSRENCPKSNPPEPCLFAEHSSRYDMRCVWCGISTFDYNRRKAAAPPAPSEPAPPESEYEFEVPPLQPLGTIEAKVVPASPPAPGAEPSKEDFEKLLDDVRAVCLTTDGKGKEAKEAVIASLEVCVRRLDRQRLVRAAQNRSLNRRLDATRTETEGLRERVAELEELGGELLERQLGHRDGFYFANGVTVGINEAGNLGVWEGDHPAEDQPALRMFNDEDYAAAFAFVAARSAPVADHE